MLIAPVIFCTIVTGIASAGELAAVGRIGVKALVYFEVVTTLALIVGLLVMDLFKPGAALDANPADLTISGSAQQYVQAAETTTWSGFLLDIIPHGVVNASTDGNVLQVLLVSSLFAVAIKALGPAGEPIVRGISRLGDATVAVITT
jgi:aerobic C4-dicarboxylate transport protein